MAKKLEDFLIALSQDATLRRAYDQNAAGAAAQFGLSKKHVTLLLEGDSKKIKAGMTIKAPTPPKESPQKPGKTIKAPQKPGKTIKAPKAVATTIKAPSQPAKTVKAPKKPAKTIKAPKAPAKTVKAPTTSAATIKAPRKPNKKK